MKKKLQAQELMVWATIGSIVMLFAGFTSAYIVKKNQSNWIEFKLPTIFWLSTIIIILSSLFLLVSIKQFKNN
ncbi:MAG: heme-copper oxidase subunit III, partial [Sediminibacterium sp.]|nr:heme-copper oxidase subunit III [Sediminibacterium sp.]